MKNGAFLYISLVLVSCGQNINSNSNDAPASNKTSIDSNCSPKSFCDSLSIIETNCINCHGSWSDYTTQDDWVNSGLISKGSASKSSLIRELQNAGGSMPRGEAPLSDADYKTLLNWINGIE